VVVLSPDCDRGEVRRLCVLEVVLVAPFGSGDDVVLPPLSCLDAFELLESPELLEQPVSPLLHLVPDALAVFGGCFFIGVVAAWATPNPSKRRRPETPIAVWVRRIRVSWIFELSKGAE